MKAASLWPHWLDWQGCREGLASVGNNVSKQQHPVSWSGRPIECSHVFQSANEESHGFISICEGLVLGEYIYTDWPSSQQADLCSSVWSRKAFFFQYDSKQHETGKSLNLGFILVLYEALWNRTMQPVDLRLYVYLIHSGHNASNNWKYSHDL